MDQTPVPILEQTKDKTKQRKAIDQEIKTKLILSVVNDRLPIYQAAILHKVKYSSAKHILRNYFNDTANFFSTQRKRKRKILCNNVFLLIDVCSGKINIRKQQPHSISCAHNGVTTILQQKFISQLSNAIYQEVHPIQKKLYKQTNEVENIQKDVQKLYEIIKMQHMCMTNLKEQY